MKPKPVQTCDDSTDSSDARALVGKGTRVGHSNSATERELASRAAAPIAKSTLGVFDGDISEDEVDFGALDAEPNGNADEVVNVSLRQTVDNVTQRVRLEPPSDNMPVLSENTPNIASIAAHHTKLCTADGIFSAARGPHPEHAPHQKTASVQRTKRSEPLPSRPSVIEERSLDANSTGYEPNRMDNSAASAKVGGLLSKSGGCNKGSYSEGKTHSANISRV
jgi:hypothetical protein